MAESTEPPYVRIAAELSRRIADRELAPGDKVPSTRQVAQEFGVALATATKALDVLRAEGLVITRPRSGTVVAPRRAAKGGEAAELTRERLLAEAIEIADGEGLEAVSMRAVASRCGVAPMSLYRFVEDKDELVAAMADTVYGSAPFDRDPGAPWRSQVESLARELWRLHRAHPWLGRTQPLTRPLPLPNIIRLGDRLLGALEELGLPPKLLMDVHVLLFSHIVGLAGNFEAEDEAASETGLSSEEWTDLQYLPRTGDSAFMVDVPHFAKLFGELGALPGGYDLDLDGLFELGLGLLLDGVEALAARLKTARPDA
ncbi:GntR family transcriptional regulator [Glycomyces algeriensis]|uniref:GntR family transcriptional regulator n=1 Tax=Glycomyces algeriensis TaxID=256037 RepID=A0A9W6LJE6_9ACTN|nr:GntR family transcriptional regulator [Glycomyces algeriensis]MDA1368256.1 GntR family transcriptional regulator [Glycomyces algeriensis]MDR7351896.1 DNA-binding transcriptional regulator YhcF (GntR family) [Glycomyces algeriensis]GLI44626.1 GntR family transcriptional regulator [Glycomyces algeriensis]